MSTILKTADKPLFPLIPLYFFLAMFCLTLGFEVFEFNQSVYDQKRFIQLGTLVLLVLVLLMDRANIVGIHSAWSNLPRLTRQALLLIALLGAISSFFAPLPKHAFQEWSLFGLLFVFTLYCSAQLVSLPAQKTVLAMLAVGISLYAWRYLAGAYLPSLGNDAVQGYGLFVGFAHPRFLNQIQSWALPLLPALPMVFRSVPRRYYWLLWLPGILGWILLFASSGRAALIAMIVSAVVVLLLFTRKSLPWLKNHVFFAIGGLILYWILLQWIPHILSVEMDLPKVTQRLAQDGLMGRDRLWGLAWDLARDNPLLGIGPQHYAYYDYHPQAAHPHSAPLQWICEWGMVSFFLVFGLLVYGFIKWVGFCKSYITGSAVEQSVMLPALTASLVAGATHALVSGVIVMPFSQMLLSIVIGWALAVYYHNKPKATQGYVVKTPPIRLKITTLVFCSPWPTPATRLFSKRIKIGRNLYPNNRNGWILTLEF